MSERSTSRAQGGVGGARLHRLRPPYRDTFDLRLDAEHVEALSALLRWVDPSNDARRPGRTSFSLARLAEIQEAVRDAR